ncbi:MAG TPA: hypothetical protein VMS86_05480 [Thermoanaerobaculia bacterium]|nr:hypothetical protein [Thermoanaerobaculia bacterium]
MGRAFLGALALLAASWYLKGRPIAPAEIDRALLSAPVQRPTSRAPFAFTYRGQACRVRPVAEYELHGLVVSHNDIESFADIYHDSSSVDTKDLCVLWGGSLQSEDSHRVRFSSGPFTCYFRYPPGIRFDPKELSNNHLITDDAAVRRRLASVNVGDQVRLQGLLVDYQMEDWRDFWRKTSTRRDDDGCEVVFVETLEVLREGAPLWNRLYRMSWALIAALPVAYLVAAWLEAGPPPATARRRFSRSRS